MSKHTIYAWKSKYGGMDVSEAQEVKQLREETSDFTICPPESPWRTIDSAHGLAANRDRVQARSQLA